MEPLGTAPLFTAMASQAASLPSGFDWDLVLKAAGFLVAARFTGEDDVVRMTMERVTSIPLAVQLPNMSQETIIQDGDRVVTINEANGASATGAPVAHVFGLDLEDRGTIPFPRIEYRVTDATDLDDAGRFWVLNYFFPPDGRLWALVRLDDEWTMAVDGQPWEQRWEFAWNPVFQRPTSMAGVAANTTTIMTRFRSIASLT